MINLDSLPPYSDIIVSEVKSGNWGVGGNALGLEDVRKIISS